MADVKWIKLATNIFDNRKIKQIEVLPDGYAIIVMWIKLLCLAGTINADGYVYFTEEIPYTDQMMAAQFNLPIHTVQMAMKVFQQFGMIDVEEDIMRIANWEKYQNTEGMERIKEQNRIRQKKWYDSHKALPNVIPNVSLTLSNATDIDIDKELDKENNKRFVKPSIQDVTDYCNERCNRIDPQRFIDYYDANGWKVGKNPMKDWKATIRNWERKDGYKPKVEEFPNDGGCLEELNKARRELEELFAGVTK